MQKELLAVLGCVVLVCFAQDAPVRHMRHHLRAPLSMEPVGMPDEVDEQQQSLQISQAITTTPVATAPATGSSERGPLTREDYGGEAPYETRELEDDEQLKPVNDDAVQTKPAPQTQPRTVSQVDEDDHFAATPDGPVYHLMPANDEGDQNIDIENTVPRLLADGRLVRVPKPGSNASVSFASSSQTSTATSATTATTTETQPSIANELPVPPPTPAAPTNKEQSAPEQVQESHRFATGSPVRLEDVQAIQLEQGSASQAKDPSPPFVGPKVRVSSLVSGMLSSVLSSVLTRGMNFASEVVTSSS